MEKPRFQFTIRGMLWATFWAAIGFATYRFMPAEIKSVNPLMPGILIFIFAATPCFALGSLLGRSEFGLWAGVLAAIVAYGFAFFIGNS